jgi:hypothetical protein
MENFGSENIVKNNINTMYDFGRIDFCTFSNVSANTIVSTFRVTSPSHVSTQS